MYSNFVFVVLALCGNIKGMPEDATKTNLEALMQEYYGPPPEPHSSLFTQEPPITQNDIEKIFGKPSVTNSNKELFPDVFGSPDYSKDYPEIDEEILKLIWPETASSIPGGPELRSGVVDIETPEPPEWVPESERNGENMGMEGVFIEAPPPEMITDVENNEINSGTVHKNGEGKETQVTSTASVETTSKPNGASKQALSTILVTVVSVFLLIFLL